MNHGAGFCMLLHLKEFSALNFLNQFSFIVIVSLRDKSVNCNINLVTNLVINIHLVTKRFVLNSPVIDIYAQNRIQTGCFLTCSKIQNRTTTEYRLKPS